MSTIEIILVAILSFVLLVGLYLAYFRSKALATKRSYKEKKSESGQKETIESRSSTQVSVQRSKRSLPIGTIVFWVIVIALLVLIALNWKPIVTWAGDTFLHRGLGDKIIYPQQQYPVTTRVRLVPSTVSIASCAPFSMDERTCILTETTIVPIAPGTRTDVHTCWCALDPKLYHSIRIILMDGSMADFDPADTSTPISGYEFTPGDKPIVLRYWLAKDCTQ